MKKFSVILILFVVFLLTLWWINVGEFERVGHSKNIDNSITVEENCVTGNQGDSNDRDSETALGAFPLDSGKESSLYTKNQSKSNSAITPRKLSTDEIRKIAERRLDRFSIDYSDRIPAVTYNGNQAICTFPVPLPPSGERGSIRGGDFIVIIDSDNGEVMDVKIWR